MKDIGLMKYKMVLGLKNGMMVVPIKVIMLWEKKKDTKNINGVIAVYIKDIGKIINYVEKLFIIILLEQKFIGEYFNNLKEGKEKYFWNDGKLYFGEYKKDKKEGIGKFGMMEGFI